MLTDMALIAAMTVVVKMQGSTFPAIQLVFIRSLIGLVTVLPLALWHWQQIAGSKVWVGHAMRVSCNAIALTCNFVALASLPLALVNAIGFMRPLVVMVLAVVLLGESVSRKRWAGAVIGFAGVLVMVGPATVALSTGLLAAFSSVFFGSLAAVQTRALRAESTTVLMAFYTVGLTVFTALPALWLWKPIGSSDLGSLLAIGLLAQAGQYCFLRAYQSTRASRLSPFSYLSIVFASIVGFVFFAEVPGWTTLIGVGIIFAGLQLSKTMPY